MNCQKCGVLNVSGEKFCKNCGCILENVNNQQNNLQNQQFISQQFQEQSYAQSNMNVNNHQNMNTNINNQQSVNITQPSYSNNMNNTQSANGNLNSNYVQQAVNPNMNKWAVLSIVVPIAGMIWYWFIGLSFYLAIIIAAAGFGFAQKGEMANKKLAIVGKVLNGMLCAMAIIMLILQLIGAFAQ